MRGEGERIMAVGALIGAYQEDDSGGLRALLPLAGRTLVEYQVRCAAAAGAAPIVVVVERVPQALQDAFERLRLDGIGVFPVSDVQEAVSRFEAGLADPADRRRRRAARGSRRELSPTSPSRRSRPCRTTSRTRRSNASTRNRAGPASRWSTRSCSGRPRRCLAIGTCSRRCSAARCRRARCGFALQTGGEPLLAERATELEQFPAHACSLPPAAPGPTGPAATSFRRSRISRPSS